MIIITLQDFIIKENLISKSEIDKIKYIAFYLYTTKEEQDFDLQEIIDILISNNFNKPNITRLKDNLKTKRDFIFNAKNNKFRLYQKCIQELKSKCNYLCINHEIISNNDLIDENLFNVNRHYIILLVKQINCSYANNLYDCCAVILRRLLEILLILAYENLKISDEIKSDDGNYKMLEFIVKNAQTNKTLNLSRSKISLDKIRDIGNLAAHKIYYNTRKSDIDEIKSNYRIIAEELLHKANLIK